MKQKTTMNRIASLSLAFALLCSVIMVAFSPKSQAAGNVTVKTISTHDIAIVFDNSGSMYQNESWCQALYAMEVFASMIDYDHDKLGIYPMGEIKIGKSGAPIQERYDISSKDDVKNIEHIYSETTSETILKPAYTATEYLKKSDLNEKWLIVLTDGEFFFDKDTETEKKEKKDAGWLNDKLLSFAGDTGINVQYLGFAEASRLNSNESQNFFATNASTGDELTGELVKICNKIFKRNIIQDVAGGKFSIDVSMNSIIAFVQGKGAKINSLTNGGGDALQPALDLKLKAGTEGTGVAKYPAPVANVSGQVHSFFKCPADSYNLDYTGDNVQIFYEPSVLIKTILTDADGNDVDITSGGEILPGEYTIQYYLADSVTGENVNDSKLLAPVELTGSIVNGGQEKPIASGDKIELTTDPDTAIKVHGTFLEDYSISNDLEEDGKGMGINIGPPPVNEKDLKVKVSVKNMDFGHKWYKYSKHEDWEPIRVDVTYKKEKVSDDVLAKGVKISMEPADKNNPFRVEQIPGESAFNVYIGQDENGEYVKPDSGKYTVKAEANIPDEYGRPLSADDEDKYEVHGYSSIWRWLIYLVILAALLIAIIIILNLPAWPRRMRFVVEKPKVDEGLKVSINKIKSTGMKIVPYEDAIRCKAKKNSKVKDKLFKPKSMSIVAYDFTSEEVRQFKVGGRVYSDAGDGFKCKGAENEVIYNGTAFEFTFLNGVKGSGHIEVY